MSKINNSVERTARVLGIPLETLQDSIQQDLKKLKVKRRKAVRRDKPVMGFTVEQYDQLISAAK